MNTTNNENENENENESIYKELYNKAGEFNKKQCWKWMADFNLFGVMDPETGEVYYCCILGNNGETFGIMAYEGTEGLENYYKILGEVFDADDPEMFHINKGIICNFCNRDEVGKEELTLIKDLGLTFRGKNKWPSFRYLTPGYVPTMLSPKQGRLFTTILEQAMVVSDLYKEKLIELETEDISKVFVRSCSKDTKNKIKWNNIYMEIQNEYRDYLIYEFGDEVRAKRIRSSAKNKVALLEVDFFYAPFPVEYENKIIFPMICAFANRETGYVYGFDMINNFETEGYKFGDSFLSILEEEKVIPLNISVCREEVYYYFEEVCKKLKIKLKLEERLISIPELRKSMIQDTNK